VVPRASQKHRWPEDDLNGHLIHWINLLPNLSSEQTVVHELGHAVDDSFTCKGGENFKLRSKFLGLRKYILSRPDLCKVWLYQLKKEKIPPDNPLSWLESEYERLGSNGVLALLKKDYSRAIKKKKWNQNFLFSSVEEPQSPPYHDSSCCSWSWKFLSGNDMREVLSRFRIVLKSHRSFIHFGNSTSLPRNLKVLTVKSRGPIEGPGNPAHESPIMPTDKPRASGSRERGREAKGN
jgi:hypothetical protein